MPAGFPAAAPPEEGRGLRRTVTVVDALSLALVAAAAYLSANEQRFHRWFGINQCLRLRRVEPT
jgi:hypothetical protein